MERLGYGYDELSKVNPQLIMASLSGYGETGPNAQLGGQDLLAQAYAGIIALQGQRDGEPQSVGSPIGDASGAVAAAWGVAVALFARERFGVGQEITTNLADALLAMSPMDWADYLNSGELRKGGRGWYANMPYGPWRARDRDIVINMQGEFGWSNFCAVTGTGELEHDPRFATNPDRIEHREELQEILDPIFRTRDAEEWRALFEGMGLRCDPVYDYRDLEEDPQTAINQMIIEQTHPEYGRIRTVGPAVKFKKTPGAAYEPDHLPPPLFAEHTRELLTELGCDDDRIAALEADGIVNTQGLAADSDMESIIAEIASRRRARASTRE